MFCIRLEELKAADENSISLGKGAKMLTSQEREYVLDQIREISKKIRDLEIQVDGLWYFIAENDEFPSNDAE